MVYENSFSRQYFPSELKLDHYRKFGVKVGLGEWLYEVYTILLP